MIYPLQKVCTLYVPGIYHEKTFWGFQMISTTAPAMRQEVSCETVVATGYYSLVHDSSGIVQ
jgi:hypothetical protein